ncbi:FKBP-type peptidyl-prolyl cis-trans isomerase [Microbacterium lushaniae]|uniref:peptidylprolyl isomerase n=1 Tax=Microbacterium lushaniae TaxID=2614639 RepID=A0A5J6L272_9MICO|nr:FKBP-type peptidyl-prolyl cis-trans isomerase [Microbacterium lushaniae]
MPRSQAIPRPNASGWGAPVSSEGLPVRIRSLTTVSLLAAAAVVLAGCSGGSAPEESPTGTPGDLCAAAAPSGAVSDSVTVEGEIGAPATATFSAPLEVVELERTVVTEGSGDAAAAGDYVAYALTAFDATSGQELAAAGYDAPLQPQQISPDNPLGQVLGCATPGSRVVAALPGDGGQNGAQVYVFDVLEVTPESQWCVAEEFSGNAPTVTFDETGAPAIGIPATEPPAEVQVQVLTEGDGETVQAGDAVEAHYTGVKWSDGSTFDSSWERGEPETFTTDGVVTGFQRALEEYTVGSVVLVAMPARCGYGEKASSQHQLAGEDLVFVVEILATEHAGQ